MMTPKEVQEHGFPRSRKGYDMAEVDEFLDKLTEDYTALYTNYGKLSSSYAKLRKKAQALASALEQMQQQSKKKQPVQEKAAPAPAPQATQAATAANQEAAEDLLRAARKDAQAIRAGAERERQEIINQATDYAAENVERLKAEVAAEEQRLATLKQSTAAYVSQVRQLLSRQEALLDSAPVDEDYTPVVAPVDEPESETAEPTGTETDEADEPTLRVDESEAAVAEEISRNMMNLRFDDDEDDTDEEDTTRAIPPLKQELDDTFPDLDDSGSLFDAIANTDSGEFDEE